MGFCGYTPFNFYKTPLARSIPIIGTITASYTYPFDIMTIPTSPMWLLSMPLVCACQWQAVPMKTGEIYDKRVRQAVDSKELIRRFNV
jgi:hypothetical protein